MRNTHVRFRRLMALILADGVCDQLTEHVEYFEESREIVAADAKLVVAVVIAALTQQQVAVWS